MRQVMFFRCAERPFDNLAVQRSNLGNAGYAQQWVATLALELTPPAISAAEQRDIRRMLEIAQPNDSRVAVRRSSIVADAKSFDTDDALTALGECSRGGGSHHSQANHDDIGRHAGSSWTPLL